MMVTGSDPGDGSVRSSTCHKSVAPSRLAAVKRVWHDCSLTCTTSELERRNMHGGPGSPCIFQRVWPVELTDDLGPCQTLSSAHGSGSTLMASVWGTLSTPYLTPLPHREKCMLQRSPTLFPPDVRGDTNKSNSTLFPCGFLTCMGGWGVFAKYPDSHTSKQRDFQLEIHPRLRR